jgi:quercetin dioxygenase-like cupin family protein
MEKVNERDCAFRGGDWGVKYLMRGPKLDWGLILLRPGQVMGEHGHRQVEETFYVLEGTPTLVVDGRKVATGPGDVFRLEPPERHDLRNEAGAAARVIFIKTPYLPDDKT